MDKPRRLAGALRRFIEEYPAVDSGLPRTERHILELLTAASRSPRQLFRDEQQLEERVFMGDWTLWQRVLHMSRGSSPLVRVDGEPIEGPELPEGSVHITDVGRDVLAGNADWVQLAGFDRWLGGVHLHAASGDDVAWRRTGATLVSRIRRSPAPR